MSKKAKKREFWAIMAVHQWTALSVAGITLQSPAKGPQHFIPVFDTLNQAMEWNSGSKENIFKLESV